MSPSEPNCQIVPAGIETDLKAGILPFGVIASVNPVAPNAASKPKLHQRPHFVSDFRGSVSVFRRRRIVHLSPNDHDQAGNGKRSGYARSIG